jgi:hypothetical protein
MGLSKAAPFSRIFNPTRGQAVVALLILWTLVNGILFACQGIITTGEAHKYVRLANYFLANGHFPTPNFQYYSIIILLVASSLKFHLGLLAVVVIQLLLSLAATLYFFNTILKIFHSERTALAGAILLLLNIPYQSFNTAIQTESIFQSLSLLASCYLLRQEQLRARHLIGILLFIVLLSLSRPLGLLYVPAVFVYYYRTAFRQAGPVRRMIFLIASSLVFLYVLDRAMGSGGEYDFMLPFQEEHIICGAPTLLHPLNFPVAGNGNSVYALIYYILHHPGQFFRLALLKSMSFWGIYRSYYSTLHNLALLLFFYPIIIMAALSLRHWWRQHRDRLIYLLTLILVTWGTVILTCDDWNIRIFLSISPYLILLSSPLLSSLFRQKE